MPYRGLTSVTKCGVKRSEGQLLTTWELLNTQKDSNSAGRVTARFKSFDKNLGTTNCGISSSLCIQRQLKRTYFSYKTTKASSCTSQSLITVNITSKRAMYRFCEHDIPLLTNSIIVNELALWLHAVIDKRSPDSSRCYLRDTVARNVRIGVESVSGWLNSPS